VGSQERKDSFVLLLQKMLVKHRGVKTRLAEELKISSARLNPWLQGKVDPASLEVVIFNRIAKINSCSIDDLALILNLEINPSQNALNKFQTLIQELLKSTTQEKLGQKLGVHQNTISNWLNDKNLDPGKIPAKTMLNIATAKGWTMQELIDYLNLDSDSEEVLDFEDLNRIKSLIKKLSITNQIELLSWLSSEFKEKLKFFNLDNDNS